MTDIKEQVKEIKQSFRQMMDGAVAKSMRDKGLAYKLNWGATLPRLREKADIYGKNYDLAIALWKEDVRECKILATMIMPAEEVLPEVIDIWMEQITSQEIAEQAVFNLFQYLPYERGINEFLDQALAALQGENIGVRKAAMAAVRRFSELGLVYERLAKSALKQINYDFL